MWVHVPDALITFCGVFPVALVLAWAPILIYRAVRRRPLFRDYDEPPKETRES